MTMPGGGRTLADAYVALHVDASKVPRDIRSQTEGPIGDAGEKAGKGFAKRMSLAIATAAAVGAAALGVKLASEIKKSIDSASDLNETLSKTEAVFGKGADAVKKWSKTMASDFGQSQKSALDAAATFAIYGKTAGKTGKDLFNFSTDLTALASDMASFSNTSPEEAISAIGAAMRGENDPIEKYGILLNEATLKSVALKKGIISTTKDALTPQQKVLAVQAALFEQLGKKGSNTIGDFERTSKGLANQQRIAQANTENLRSEIGQAFLPVMLKVYSVFNDKVIPTLRTLWQEQGPAVTKFLENATVKFGDWFAKLDEVDWRGIAADVGEFFGKLKDGTSSGVSDTISVFGVVIKLAADHIDLFAAALPYLTIALGAYKVAQLGANVAAVAGTAARIASSIATKTDTAAENAGILAKGRAAIVTGVQRGATLLGTAATWLATAATTALGVALKVAMGPIGLVITAIALLTAGVIYAYKHNETFRNIVNKVWAAVKVAIKAVGDWFVNTLWPALKTAISALGTAFKTWWNIVTTVWKGVWTVISTYYGFMWNKVFLPLKNVITKTIPDAFHTGSAAIGKAWEAVKGAASKPVEFVVNTVLNQGIIGSLNKLAGWVGIDKKIPSVSFNPKGDGYGRAAPAPSGRRGDMTGDGIGSVIMNPVKWFTNKIGLGRIASKFGKNPLVDVLTGAGTRAKDWALEKVKSMISEFFGRGGGGSMTSSGLRSGIATVLGSLRGVFGNVPLISGLRPGATTLTGNTSYHASGRAIDIAPVFSWAQYLHDRFGRSLKELITPWQELNLHNGRPHRYTGAVWNQHNFAGGNAHIHAAMDDGGRRFLMPGLNVIPNGTGAKEPIYGPAEIREVVDVLLRILAALGSLAPQIGRELGGATAAALTIARAR